MKILNFPLTRIFIGFLFGLLVFQMISLDSLLIVISLSFCIIGICISYLFSQKNNLAKTIFGLFVILSSIIIGISTAKIHKQNANPEHYLNQKHDYEKPIKTVLLINEKLKSTKKNNRYVASVKSINKQYSYGKVILNIPKVNRTSIIKIGNYIEVTAFLYKNKTPSNPNLFDYGKYLENQEIYAQIFTTKIIIRILNHDTSLWSNFSNFREKIISNLNRSQISKKELNVLNALILGQQQEISPEILKDYQHAGAVHILSVSGLHVGFILLFLTYILKPIGNTKTGSLLKLGITLLSLWSFAILTGLSPSIVRSATMFSFIGIGIHLRRTVNIYHNLIVSMLLILLYKPSFLFDVGFQLSYLALFFIIWLQPILSTIWEPKNKIAKYFWDIITVSFAAQIGTMPLSIYYFHQFPGLFFVTNLLILPLLGIIMAIGVIAIIIATFDTVPFIIAKSIELLITLLNSIIHWVSSIDSFVIKNISFSKEMLLSSYLVIILIIFWIKKPLFNRLIVAFLSIVLLQIILIFQKKDTHNKSEFIVFHCKKNTIITERVGDLVSIQSNDSILETIDDNLLIQSYLIGNFCKIKSKKSIENLIYFNSHKIMIIDSSGLYSKTLKPDILIIVQSPKINFQRLLTIYKPKKVVVDGSNYKSYVKFWEATCKKEKIPFHYTNEKGFYKI